MRISSITNFSTKSEIKNHNHSENQQSYINTRQKNITNLPGFSNNQYLVNFKGLEIFPKKDGRCGAEPDLSHADIEIVKQELDNLFSKTEKLTTNEDKKEFETFITEPDRDDISAIAFSYLKKEPELLNKLSSNENTWFYPLRDWGSGATKALLEYVEDKPKLRKQVLFSSPSGFTAKSPLSENGARGIWDYFKDKDKEFKEFVLKSKCNYMESPFFDEYDGVAIKILNRFKNDDETLRELLFLENRDGGYIFTPRYSVYSDRLSEATIDVLKWIEKEKTELFKEIGHTADLKGKTILDLLPTRNSFICYFNDKKDIIDKMFLREVNAKDDSKVIAGDDLRGNALSFALSCVKDKLRVYKYLKDNNKMDMLNSANGQTLVSFFDDILSKYKEDEIVKILML